jgi:hypothetical protein
VFRHGAVSDVVTADELSGEGDAERILEGLIGSADELPAAVGSS